MIILSGSLLLFRFDYYFILYFGMQIYMIIHCCVLSRIVIFFKISSYLSKSSMFFDFFFNFKILGNPNQCGNFLKDFMSET